MGDERPIPVSTGAIKKKKDDKVRRRDQRSWENVLKSTANKSEDEKITIIQEKYNEMYNDLRKTTSTLQVMEKQLTVLQKEKDHTQAELTKHIMAKSKLEGLCRELQKQNKVIKDENITRIKEEEERRREVATSFTEKLNTLTALMDENKDKSVRLREENMSMTTKLTELYDQFQERESHLAHMNRQLELQKKLSDTQIKKLEVEQENERQLWEKERQMLLTNLENSDQANLILQDNIKGLQEHLDLYKSQYSDFETTMQKSNKVFDAFKEEMTKMQKLNASLEKERNEYRNRWQSCTNSILQISELHQQTSAELKISERKVQMLEKLCRQLQAERAAYIQQLEENNIKPKPPTQQEEKPEASTSTPSLSSTAQKKLTKKEKLLVALKSELKVMEDQLKKKMTTKHKELAALERDLKLVVEQRKIASKQEACRKEASKQGEAASSDDPASTSTEDTTVHESTSATDTSVAEEVPIKKAVSCPVTTEKFNQSDSGSSTSTSLDDLSPKVSVATVPLSKSEPVTDFTFQPDSGIFVSEVGTRTTLTTTDDSTVTTLLDEGLSTDEMSVTMFDNFPVNSEEQSDSGSSGSASLSDVLSKLSTGTVPLYKSEAVTNITIHPESGILVSEAEARTNLLASEQEESTSTDKIATSNESTCSTSTDALGSTSTDALGSTSTDALCSTSGDVLLPELSSLSGIPLYSPEGVTDLTVQSESGVFSGEADASIILLEASASAEVQESVSASTQETEDTKAAQSSGTIPLKETEGKTDLSKKA